MRKKTEMRKRRWRRWRWTEKYRGKSFCVFETRICEVDLVVRRPAASRRNSPRLLKMSKFRFPPGRQRSLPRPLRSQRVDGSLPRPSFPRTCDRPPPRPSLTRRFDNFHRHPSVATPMPSPTPNLVPKPIPTPRPTERHEESDDIRRRDSSLRNVLASFVSRRDTNPSATQCRRKFRLKIRPKFPKAIRFLRVNPRRSR